MGLSRVANRWLNRLYKSIAILLVLFAVLISALRMFLPHVQNYRQEIQDHINTQNQSNIAFGKLNVEWKKEGPLLIAENVRILQTETASIFIQKIDFHLDFWRTLTEQRITTSSLKLDGARIYIDQSMLDTSSSSERDLSLIDSTSELFLEQISKFSLNNAEVILHRENFHHTFKINQLRWRNLGNRHYANGEVMLDGLTSNTLKLKLDVIGGDLADMSGQLFVEAKQVNITPWLDKIFVLDDEDTHANINFQSWLTIDEGKGKALQVSLGNNDITFNHKGEQQNLSLTGGNINVENLHIPEKLLLQSSDIVVSTNDYIWKPMTASVRRDQYTEFLHVSQVDLKGVAEIAPLFIEELELIEKLNLQGTLNDVYIREFSGDIQAVGQFADVSSQYSNGIPGIEHLSGEFIYNTEWFKASVFAQDGALDFADNFKQTLPYQSLSANISGHESDEGWDLAFENVTLLSSELSLQADVSVDLPNEGDASMALLAALENVDAKDIPHYYPHLLMGDNLVKYLTDGILHGTVSQAQVLFNGPFSTFPFTDHSGIFSVNAELNNSIFSFDSEWPSIQGFDANLNFTNNGMIITGREGKLNGVDVKGVTAVIKDFDTQQLEVKAQFQEALSSNVSKLMQNSPLADSVGETLKELVVSGFLAGDFTLNVPLDTPENAVSKGNVYFNENLMNLQTPAMDFTQVTGKLSFENDKIDVNNLQLNWAGLPLSLEVHAQNMDDLYQTNINLVALWKQEEWMLHTPNRLQKYLEGDVSWQGDLSLNIHHDGQFTYDFNVKSTFKELALDLPVPYQKPLAQETKFTAMASGNDATTSLDIFLGENLNFYGEFDHHKEVFLRSHLILGQEKMLLPRNGFFITTKLDRIEVAEWQPFILDIIQTANAEVILQHLGEEEINEPKEPILSTPERVRGKISEVTFFDKKIHDVTFDVNQKSFGWQADISAKELRGDVVFNPGSPDEGITIDADFVNLPWKALDDALAAEPLKENSVKPKHTQPESPVDYAQVFESIPLLNVTCESCTIGHLSLGKVKFTIDRPEFNMLRIEDFTAKRGKAKLNFGLSWTLDENKSFTRLHGDMYVDDFEQELKRFGYPSTVRDSGLNSTFDLTWQGAPFEMPVNTLNGGASAKLNEGYLAEVNDKGARIFSVLSLQSLVRKLTLDFRDIFSDGMFYSEIKGDFKIKNGVLYTDNTYMKGSAGDLSVKGNTDLNQHKVDYRMSYKPNLTSSLPVLAWIATLNPVTFLAGVALDEVITSQVVSEFSFELTGDMNDPVLREVNRKNKDVSVGRSTPPQIVDNDSPAPLSPTPDNNSSGSEQEKSIKPKTGIKPQVNQFNG